MTNDKPIPAPSTVEELALLIRKKTVVPLRELEDADYDVPARAAYTILQNVLEAEKKEGRLYTLTEEDNQNTWGRLAMAFKKVPKSMEIK